MLAAELPKLTDWMQAWGSLLGVAVSTLAVLITGALLRHEMRARREDKEDADAAQARLIVTDVTALARGSGPVDTAVITVTNHSAAAIVEAHAYIQGKSNFRGGLGGRGQMFYRQHIAPGSEAKANIVLREPMHPKEFYLLAEVAIFFTDTAGRFWTKFGTKAPVRMRKAEKQAGVSALRFWPTLWDYLWPLSTPVRSVPRGLRWARRRVQGAVDAMTLRMHRQVFTRTSKQMRVKLDKERKPSGAGRADDVQAASDRLDR
ncbi:hypothetical protein [Micromonospora arborensis]|uniref:hypothetical protein n=1 Tax=Micromonospora arborensis TaxID=2116518 RepID=UPI003712AD50